MTFFLLNSTQQSVHWRVAIHGLSSCDALLFFCSAMMMMRMMMMMMMMMIPFFCFCNFALVKINEAHARLGSGLFLSDHSGRFSFPQRPQRPPHVPPFPLFPVPFSALPFPIVPSSLSPFLPFSLPPFPVSPFSSECVNASRQKQVMGKLPPLGRLR